MGGLDVANPYEDALGTVDRMDQRLANWQALDQPPASDVGLSLAQSAPGGPGFLEQGLGLAQRGIEAITPSSDTLYKLAQGLEAAAAVGQGRTPLYLQEQHLDLQRQQMQGAAEERKQMMALRIQQAEEQKRQHNWGIAEKLISTGNMGALEEFGKSFPDVMPIVQGVSKQHLSSLPVLAKGGYLPEEIVQRIMSPKPDDQPMTPAELSMHVKLGMENWQADIKEQAKNKLLTDALDTPKEKRKPHQQLLVDEHQKKLDLQEADIGLKNAQAKKALAEAKEGPPDHSEAGRVHEAMTGKKWAEGTPATQMAALELKSKLYPQGKQTVTEEVPVGQTGNAQEWRDPVTGQAAPSWATKKQLAELGFVNIEPAQIAAVNGIRNVDAAMKEILAAGSSLVRNEGASSLMDIPRGMVQMPIVSLIRKYAGSPDAAVLDSAIKRISPTLAKLSGDTGNIALAEQQMYASSIFSDADTLESLQAKIRSIEQAQTRTRQALGFVPDEKAYLRRLIIQGKTDEQIKATMAERKRYQ